MVETTSAVAEAHGGETGGARAFIVGCGGWSERRTVYGGDHWRGREDTRLDPLTDAAKGRNREHDPRCLRKRGSARGFRAFRGGSYADRSSALTSSRVWALESLGVLLANGESLPIVRMEKRVRMES